MSEDKPYLHNVDAVAFDGRTGEPKTLRVLTPEEWEGVRRWWENEFTEFERSESESTYDDVWIMPPNQAE